MLPPGPWRLPLWICHWMRWEPPWIKILQILRYKENILWFLHILNPLILKISQIPRWLDVLWWIRWHPKVTTIRATSLRCEQLEATGCRPKKSVITTRWGTTVYIERQKLIGIPKKSILEFGLEKSLFFFFAGMAHCFPEYHKGIPYSSETFLSKGHLCSSQWNVFVVRFAAFIPIYGHNGLQDITGLYSLYLHWWVAHLYWTR